MRHAQVAVEVSRALYLPVCLDQSVDQVSYYHEGVYDPSVLHPSRRARSRFRFASADGDVVVEGLEICGRKLEVCLVHRDMVRRQDAHVW